jgi:glycosyltransferase involved in cell wall biosynthesis
MNTFNELFLSETDYWALDENRPKHEIAFLISDQHFIATGGIGQYAYAFYKMCLRKRIRVHFILDKQPTKQFFVDLFDKAVFHYPLEPIAYTLHSNTYVHTDTMNMYKQANFHTAIQKAEKWLSDNDKLFAMYICNTSESIIPAYSANCTPLVIYTHLYKHIHIDADNGKFSDNFHNLVEHLSKLPNVYPATQSLHNKLILKQRYDKVQILPIPFTEEKFLEKYDRENVRGVLFVGRYEKGKRPDKFLQLCKKANLPVKILTSQKSSKKFIEKCIELGLEHDVRHNLVGQEKVDFMLSSAFLLNVSKNESFSMTTLECIGHMPVVTLDDQPWTEHFDKKFLSVCSKDKIVWTMKQYHEKQWTLDFLPKTWYQNGSLEYVKQHQDFAYDVFDTFLEDTLKA